MDTRTKLRTPCGEGIIKKIAEAPMHLIWDLVKRETEPRHKHEFGTYAEKAVV